MQHQGTCERVEYTFDPVIIGRHSHAFFRLYGKGMWHD